MASPAPLLSRVAANSEALFQRCWDLRSAFCRNLRPVQRAPSAACPDRYVQGPGLFHQRFVAPYPVGGSEHSSPVQVLRYVSRWPGATIWAMLMNLLDPLASRPSRPPPSNLTGGTTTACSSS